MKLREIVARNVKQLRMEKRWTQKELARKAKMADKYLSFIEVDSRNISLDQLEKLAKALDVTVSALIFEDRGPRSKRNELDTHFERMKKETEKLEGSLETLKSQIQACRASALEK